MEKNQPNVHVSPVIVLRLHTSVVKMSYSKDGHIKGDVHGRPFSERPNTAQLFSTHLSEPGSKYNKIQRP